jgi:hypothetical protein
MPEIIWTEDQVANLNRWQQRAPMHPFTCGLRDQPGHKEYAQAENLRDHGLLVATPEGWVCPTPGCEYTQDWAHDFMVEYTEEVLQEYESRLASIMKNADGN